MLDAVELVHLLGLAAEWNAQVSAVGTIESGRLVGHPHLLH